MSHPPEYQLRQRTRSRPGFYKIHGDSEIDKSDWSTDDDCDVAGNEEHDDSSTDESCSDGPYESSFIDSEFDYYGNLAGSDEFSPNLDDQSTESECESSASVEDEGLFLFETDDKFVVVEAQGYTEDASEKPKALGIQCEVQRN